VLGILGMGYNSYQTVNYCANKTTCICTTGYRDIITIFTIL